jgi:hypothetical protein
MQRNNGASGSTLEVLHEQNVAVHAPLGGHLCLVQALCGLRVGLCPGLHFLLVSQLVLISHSLAFLLRTWYMGTSCGSVAAAAMH